MNDKEFLNFAAKAAGIDLKFKGTIPYSCTGLGASIWDPLSDDGDALRLAVDLNLRIYPCARTSEGYACSAVADGAGARLSDVICSGDTRADVRRAIVLAAAEIGKAMP